MYKALCPVPKSGFLVGNQDIFHSSVSFKSFSSSGVNLSRVETARVKCCAFWIDKTKIVDKSN